MNKAAFSLENYRFEKVQIDLSKKLAKDVLIDFKPSGKFDPKSSSYELIIVFYAFENKIENSFIEIECISIFKFEDKIEFENIPSYFYRNCIAIIFPFIRAFISTVTLQANVPPIMLPTMNLSSLEIPLKENTIQI